MTTQTTTAPSPADSANAGTSRRTFLKWSAAVGGTSALAATAVTALGMPTTRATAAVDGMADVDATVQSACVVNCGSRCAIRLQVKDGVVVRVLPDNTGDDTVENRSLRACPRGRNIRERIYSPDRIKTPLKRKEGTPRGGGEWEEISWDEAIDLLYEKLKYTYDTYGPGAIYKNYGSGTWNSDIAYYGGWQRLFNLLGGHLGYYGNYSYGTLWGPCDAMFGNTEQTSNSFEETLANGEILVLWGNNPYERRMSGGGLYYIMTKIKEAGIKVICIDPRYSDTAMHADEYYAIRPGTDAALAAGMAHVMITENRHNQEFLDRYCVGFDESTMPEGVPAGNSYRSYVMGEGEDGIEKTPEWAADITGIPAQQIVQLARTLTSGRKVNVTQGWGLQRHANGETQCRAIYTIGAMIGQVGLPGGGTGGQEGYFWPVNSYFPSGDNPYPATISYYSWPRAIEEGEKMTALNGGVQGADKLDSSIKFMLSYAGNMLASQHGDINYLRELLQDESKCEFIVSCDNQMTPSCELSDLVLPDTTTAERDDTVPSEYTGDMAYWIATNKAIEPLYDSKDAYEVCVLLAEKFGVRDEFTEGNETMRDWAETIYKETVETNPQYGWPATYEEFREKGVHRYFSEDGLTIPMKAFREDPVANPLPTPSGKIEIFSKTMWDAAQTWEIKDPRKGDVIDAIGLHRETWEGPEEARTNEEYPLQMISHHYKGRTHSTYGNLPKNREAHPQKVWINTADAAERGIVHGEQMDVWNDRGHIRCEAYVTPRIMPGVISVPQGAWLDLDKNGIDHGGAANMLYSAHPTPYSKGNPQQTALVQAGKAPTA